jgi:succinylglutamic semialdehyde dehydrogenase
MTVFVNGIWQAGEGPRLTSSDPAKEVVIWESDMASQSQVDAAFQAADKAFASWKACDFDERLGYIEYYQALLQENKDDLSLAIARETGKPLWESQTEVASMIAKIDISVQAYHERTGSMREQKNHLQLRMTHLPHGVLAVLGPFNFPGHLPNGHIVPALLAGNTIVFKPSELTPMVGQKLIELWQQAGLPDGVINYLPGDRTIGEAMLKAPELAGVLFTGSYQTGAAIHRQFAGRPEVLLALEMGGNNPLAVWEAKASDQIISLVMQSAFLSAGQRCSCARRLIVEKGPCADELLARLADTIGKLLIDDYDSSPQPFMGCLISPAAVDKVLSAQASLVQRGAKLLCEATRLSMSPSFVTPALIDVTDLETPDEEVFGPMLLVKRVESVDALIREANNTRYGLSASILTDNQALAMQFMSQVNAGIINWNASTVGAASSQPFGGVGCSGNHRPSAYYAADYCAYPVASQCYPNLKDAPVLEWFKS